jgi:general secretion pathway protein J
MEVMMAVTIVSIMGGLIWGSFGPFLRSKEVVEAESEHYRVINGALSRMCRELSMAFVSNDFDRLRYHDNHDMPTFFTGQRDRMMFTAFAHQRRYQDAKEGDQALYEYRIGHDPDDIGAFKDVLLHREKTVFEEDVDHGGVNEVLCDDLKKISFEYYDDSKKEWLEEWDTRHDMTVLPERVRITITSTDEQGKDVKYSMQTKIFMRQPIHH